MIPDRISGLKTAVLTSVETFIFLQSEVVKIFEQKVEKEHQDLEMR